MVIRHFRGWQRASEVHEHGTDRSQPTSRGFDESRRLPALLHVSRVPVESIRYRQHPMSVRQSVYRHATRVYVLGTGPAHFQPSWSLTTAFCRQLTTWHQPPVTSGTYESSMLLTIWRERSSMELKGLYTSIFLLEHGWFMIYTVNHKKRDILFLTITLANLSRFLQFLYNFNREEILHVIIIKFITSPDLCAHLTVWCKLDQAVVNHAIDEWRRRLSACVDAEGRHFEHYLWLLLSK